MNDNVFNLISTNLFFGCEKWIDEDRAYFCDVKGSMINKLLLAKIIDDNSKSIYYAPSVKEFTKFLNNYPRSLACHGSVRIKDGEPIITIEGLHSTGTFFTDLKDGFVKFCKTADVLRYDDILLYSRWNTN